jgi:hypothetical protein
MKRIKSKYFLPDGRFSRKYATHLDRFGSLRGSCPFRAFGGGFFHDGEIRHLNFSPLRGELTFTISAPNFHLKSCNASLMLDFHVKFSGVTYYSVEIESDHIANPRESLIFLRSEFNSMGIASDVDLQKYSDYSTNNETGVCEILLDCIGNDSVLIGLVFSAFSVTPENDALFYLVCKECNLDYSMFRMSTPNT